MTTSLLLGAGDLGAQIGSLLAAAGSDVVAVRRRAALVPQPMMGVSCDLTSGRDAIRAALEPLVERPGWERGPQYLVVCLTADGRDEDAYRRTYVDAVTQALGVISDAGWQPERAVFVSSTAVCASDGPVDENTPADPSTPTARVLAEAEAAFVAGLPSRTKGVVVRPSGIYGPGREWFVNRVRAGDIGDPARVTHRVHRDDVAAAVSHLLTMRAEPESLYLVTDDAPASAGEVARAVATLLDVDADPAWSTPAEDGRRMSNARLRRTGFEFTYPTHREGYAAVLDGDGERRP